MKTLVKLFVIQLVVLASSLGLASSQRLVAHTTQSESSAAQNSIQNFTGRPPSTEPQKSPPTQPSVEPLRQQPAVESPGQQKPALSVKRLTLTEAFDMANRQNLELATARLRRAVSQAGIRIAGQLPNPSIIFNAARDTPHESLLFDQQFDINGKRRRRVEFARQQDTLVGLEMDTLVRQVRRRVRLAFYAAARTHGTTVYQQNTLSLAQRLRDIAQSRFEAGDIPQLDVLQADLEVARAQTEFSIAQQREKIAASDLNLLLNEPTDKIWDLGEPLEAPPPAFSLDDLITRAHGTNADLMHLAQEVKVEEARLRSLRAERIPSLGIQAGADFNSPAGPADPVTGNAGGFKIGGRGQLTVPVPIFSRNQGEIAQSFATSRVLESQIATSRRAVSGRVAAVYYEWSTRQAQVEMYKRTLLPATQKLENMMEESYRAGRANLLNVLDAQRNVQMVQRDYLDSLLALQNAFADLEEVVGVPLD